MAVVVASKLHSDEGHVGADASVRQVQRPPAPMARDLQTRFFAVILALLSVAAVIFGWINFQKDREFVAPYDGVWWVEDGGHQEGRSSGCHQWARRCQRRQLGAAALPRGSLVEGEVLAGAPGCAAG